MNKAKTTASGFLRAQRRKERTEAQNVKRARRLDRREARRHPQNAVIEAES